MDEESSSSLEAALADIEIVCSAYEEEVTTSSIVVGDSSSASFPLHFTIHLKDETEQTAGSSSSSSSYVTLELTSGYPTSTGIRISSHHVNQPSHNNNLSRMDATLAAVQQASEECLRDGIEAGFACCASALDTWNNFVPKEPKNIKGTPSSSSGDAGTSDSNDKSSTPKYSAISTHHLFDHKPDNQLRTAGNKCKLKGYFKFGTPGIALVWHSTPGDDMAMDNFIDTLKSAMPQKKFEILFTKEWNPDNNKSGEDKNGPTGWTEQSSAGDLKAVLDDLGVPEEDYYTVLGLDGPKKSAKANNNEGSNPDTATSKGKGKKKGSAKGKR